MVKYHTVYLSLGSNIGDRLSHLNHALNKIQENVGLITKASSVYESPAWGYQSSEIFFKYCC